MAKGMTRDLNHPVWNLYDSLRTARLNVLYYEKKLYYSEKILISMQIILAAAVPSSAIAGFEVWDFGLGEYAWAIFVSFASFVAFIQPFLGIPKKAKKYSELVDGYKVLFYDLKDIRDKIGEDKAYNSRHKKLFDAAKKRRKRLEVRETGIEVSKKLRSKCQQAVASELPAHSFYLP